VTGVAGTSSVFLLIDRGNQPVPLALSNAGRHCSCGIVPFLRRIKRRKCGVFN